MPTDQMSVAATDHLVRAEHLLGAHVERRAEDLAGPRHRELLVCRSTSGFTRPKSSSLTTTRSERRMPRRPGSMQEDVARLEIAVHEPGVVHARQPGRHLLQQLHDFGGVETSAAPDMARQILALEQLHDDERRAVELGRRCPASTTRTTCSLRTCASERASRPKRSRIGGGAAAVHEEHLHRQRLAGVQCATLSTRPMLPRPSSREHAIAAADRLGSRGAVPSSEVSLRFGRDEPDAARPRLRASSCARRRSRRDSRRWRVTLRCPRPPWLPCSRRRGRCESSRRSDRGCRSPSRRR